MGYTRGWLIAVLIIIAACAAPVPLVPPPLVKGGTFNPVEPAIRGEAGKPLPQVSWPAKPTAQAAGDIPVFSESLGDTLSRFDNLSWNTSLETTAQPVRSGTASLRLKMNGWGALYLNAKTPISGATGLSFWIYGDASLKVQCLANNQDVGGTIIQSSLGWQQIQVSIADCGNPAQINQIMLQNYSAGSREVFVDDFFIASTPISSDNGLSGTKLEARALVITGDRNDPGYKAWTALLDNLGTPYEVLVASEKDLTKDLLVSGGIGRFNAILLSNNSLAYGQNGQLVQPFRLEEWQLLWAYERGFAVRQVVLYGFPNDYPEESCARMTSSRSIADTPENFALTPGGSSIFPYLKPDAPISVRFSFVYSTQLVASCPNVQTLMSDASGSPVAFTSTTPDGRERLMLTFGSNPVFLHFQLIGYGLLRWATKGLFLGERKHFLNIDVDDWFATADLRRTDGSIDLSGFRISAKDGLDVWQRVLDFRTQWSPLLDQRSFLSNFNVNIAYNSGASSNPTTFASCDPNVSAPDPLTAISRCLAGRLRWINHTYSHQDMDTANYALAFSEISKNISVGQQLGFYNYPEVLKTGEIAGLGYYATPPSEVKVDHGLLASNPDLLKAAKDAGIKYLHGNTSVKSQLPACNNCLIRHPLEASLSIIAVRPTNIYYFTSTPEEATSAYNAVYGPAGSAPFWLQNLSYSEVLDKETDVALYYLLNGAVNSTYFHQANLRGFEPGRNLVFDWANALMSKYARFYTQPLRSLPWSGPGSIVEYVENRNTHFASLGSVRLVYDRTSRSATLSATANAKVFLTGAQIGTWENYAGDNVSLIQMTPGQSVGFDPR